MRKGVQFARKLRRETTDAERRIWARLRNRRLPGFKFRRQHPVAGYIADFVCLERRLIVELDGSQHASAEVAADDVARTRRLNECGFRILRFWNNESLQTTDAVVDALAAALAPSPQPSPPKGAGKT
jgi:very-short-patch-repair endonuclease